MHDVAFYNVGCEAPRGKRRLVVPLRRLLRRLMRPMLFRQAELFAALFARQAEQAHAFQALVEALAAAQSEVRALRAEVDEAQQSSKALGWDHVAITRRLAVMEDHVEAQSPDSPPAQAEPRPFPLVLFPGMDRDPEPSRAKVS